MSYCLCFLQALLANEKQSVIKLIDEIISRTVVRCSFRLSDNQENANSSTLYNSSSLASYPDTTKRVRYAIEYL
jgi:hypothetical protein